VYIAHELSGIVTRDPSVREVKS